MKRFAALGISSLLAGLVIIVAYLSLLDVQLHRALDRATTRAEATVTAIDPDDDTVFRARWRDVRQREHTQRFSTYSSYTKGGIFDVVYDPAHPDHMAFAADPEERSAADDYEVPMALAAVVALGCVAGWGYRWWRFRRTRAAPALATPAALFSGAPNDGSPLTLGRGLWLRLNDDRWQKVMWAPALHDFTEGKVQVHGDLPSRRRVVVELADGTMLIPAGRLRSKPPRRVDLVRERHTRLDDEQWIFPAGTPAPPVQRWWRQPALLGLVGAGVGCLAGLAAGGLVALPAMAAAFAALAINGWAMTSPAP